MADRQSDLDFIQDKTRKGPNPASYLIRRSTFIAVGFAFDSPTHDPSAGVENRVIQENGSCFSSTRDVHCPHAALSSSKNSGSGGADKDA